MSVFQVPEIHCDACIRALTNAVRQLDMHATLQADLQAKQVDVETTASDAAVVEAMRDAGFTVVPSDQRLSQSPASDGRSILTAVDIDRSLGSSRGR